MVFCATAGSGGTINGRDIVDEALVLANYDELITIDTPLLTL